MQTIHAFLLKFSKQGHSYSVFFSFSLLTGTIEIINDVHILKPGDKVGASEATLLNMLNISPFSYGLLVEQVYDSGTIFAPEILDIKPEDLREKFLAGVANLAAVCLSIGYPTVASAPHSIVNGFKNLLAIAAVTDVEFKEAQTVKEYIKVNFSCLLLMFNDH